MDAETNLTRDASRRVIDLGTPRASVETGLTQPRASVETGLGLAPAPPTTQALITSDGDTLITSGGDTLIWST